MTLRERLADWISGGALTRARKDAQRHFDDAEYWISESMEEDVKFGEMLAALRAIIAQETPSANATVRRMVRIARDALK
jgi:hypothetical protein